MLGLKIMEIIGIATTTFIGIVAIGKFTGIIKVDFSIDNAEEDFDIREFEERLRNTNGILNKIKEGIKEIKKRKTT